MLINTASTFKACYVPNMYTPCKTFSKQMLLLSVYGQDHTASEGAQLSEYVCAVEAGLLERT